jgi:hypothetical protein
MVSAEHNKTMPGSWGVTRIPLGWMIHEGLKKIAHTAAGLGDDEGRLIAQRIVDAPDMRVALEDALQAHTVLLFEETK